MALSSVALAYLLIRFSSFVESLGAWGYVGVAAAEFSNSAMIVLPTPALAYTFTMGSVLNPFAIGVVGGLFATLGELVGYGLGRRGGRLLPNAPVIQRLISWTDRWGAIVLFVSASLPVPFDFAGIWAGTARYPLCRFFPIVLVGKSIKVTIVALAGYYGVDFLSSVVGLI